MTNSPQEIFERMQAAVAALPHTDESHLLVQWEGKGCQRCGKNENGKAHTNFHAAARDARRAARDL